VSRNVTRALGPLALENQGVKRHSAREVDLETDVGPLRIGLWSDGWVLAWRRKGADARDEVFDVYAADPEALAIPLRKLGMTEEAAHQLATELVAERAMMDRED
jgi:hypothetical protein